MADTVEVNVKQGGLRGKKQTTFNNVEYYSFQGIPYAKPPVGPLRFKAPQPAEPWDGVRDAFSVGNAAPQEEKMFLNKYIGEEDCLFLNVYTPQLPSGSSGKKKPVMVWIHGGAFKLGSGDTSLYGPDHLIAGDVVLVTFNYRLGPLGFLYTEDSATSGNNGLKDQVLAMRWVQQNIEQFGGDPNNVTIFGESAGGASVHYQMLSPMSKGLFHKAVLQSGCALNPWAFIPRPREKAFRLGAVLGCHTADSEILVRFLRSVPAKELTQAEEEITTAEEKGNTEIHYGPCVETDVAEGDETFLPTNPYTLLSSGKFHKVPCVLGFTSHEGMLLLRSIYENPLALEMLTNKEDSIVPYTITIQKNTPKSKELGSKIREYYFGDKLIDMETLPELVDMYSDAFFIHGLRKTAELQLKHADTPQYMYQFSFYERLEMLEKIIGGEGIPGVCHGADIPYLFKGIFLGEERFKPNTDHRKMIDIMVKLWTNFAKTGNPTPNGDKDVGINWKPVSKSTQVFLDINLPTSSLKDDKKRYEFWDSIHKEL